MHCKFAPHLVLVCRPLITLITFDIDLDSTVLARTFGGLCIIADISGGKKNIHNMFCYNIFKRQFTPGDNSYTKMHYQ